MPEVSIIVPAWNAEKTISRCIESILKQTWTDFELLLMDDGSDDGTPEIIDRYAEQDSRIRVVHKANSGVSDTRNQALSLAAGTYLQFLDADDWIAPDATRLFVCTMEENDGCDMIIADFYRVVGKRMSQKGDIEEERLITKEEYAAYMMRSPADYYYGVLWNKFFRRSIIREYGLRMDENLSWAEDFIFNMEYILHTERIFVLKVPVYYYVKTEGSLVTQNSMNIARTVQMKLNVVEYYNSFYQNIYPPGDYHLRRPSIYAFLLNFAKDGTVSPVMPDRRMGQSRFHVHFAPEAGENVFVSNYYEDRLLETAVERVMKGNDLEKNDVHLLLYLYLAGGTASVPEIRNYTGLSGRAVSISTQKLVHRRFVERVKAGKASQSVAVEEEKENAGNTGKERETGEPEPAVLTFGRESQKIQEAIERSLRYVEELQFRDFTEQDREQYRRLRGRVTENVYRALSETE